MSWSLDIDLSGDLVTTTGQFGKITGRDKLQQDLAHWILTKMGTDLLNTGYGSTINGGVQPDGTIISSVIGGPFQTSAIDVELRRIVGAYQQQQVVRAQDDQEAWNKTTLTADEIIASLDAIDYQQIADQLLATISITTAANTTLDVNIAIPGL